MALIIEGDKLKAKFTAGASITKGQVVYVSGANEVSPATDAEAARCIGVADNDAAAGEEVEVVIYGIAEVVADGAISPGDRVRAASTAGRVVAENSLPAHSHVAFKNSGTDASPSTSATQKVVGGDGVEAANVYVTVESGAGAEEIKTSSNSAGEHGRCIGIALGSASAVGDKLMILVCKV